METSLTLELRARISAPHLPGTWGFGLWNDPFGLSLGFGGNAARLPTFPEAAWFFHGSAPNYLSLRNDLPAQGFFAGTFHSARMSSLLLTPFLLALPFLALRPISRLFRKLAGRFVHQAGTAIKIDATAWHGYSLKWECERVDFAVDGHRILETPISPRTPLGLVLWIDNQFASWNPEGRFGYGTLENPEAWLELESIRINGLDSAKK